MTSLIEQRTPDQCAIATIAMATGFTYEVVLELADELYEPGKGTYGLSEILKRLGLTDEDFCPYFRCVVDPNYFRQWLWGRRAMVQVPSLNIKDGMHIVYWTGKEVLDPNPPTKKRYTEFKELKPEYVWLFNETK